MSRCVICNKQISRGAYFCDRCLKEEVGEAPKRKAIPILSWLAFSPFQAKTTFRTNWAEDEEKVRWVIKRVDMIKDRYPDVSTTHVIDRTCKIANIKPEKYRQQISAELEQIRKKKNGPIWAPWDVVLQPVIPALALLIAISFVLIVVL